MKNHKSIMLELFLGLIIIAVTAGVFACAVSNDATLEGVTWVLESYGRPDNLKAPAAEKEVTLILDAEKKSAGGNAGVNIYGGNYEIDGNDITITRIITTLMFRPEPFQSQEDAYLKILESARTFKIDGTKLTITGIEGILVFTQKQDNSG
jgi:heat shock protein HslJ